VLQSAAVPSREQGVDAPGIMLENKQALYFFSCNTHHPIVAVAILTTPFLKPNYPNKIFTKLCFISRPSSTLSRSPLRLCIYKRDEDISGLQCTGCR
jgi:hypothetical protein